ncbi:MAG TPA: L,D-transpeptidase, partial [Beijerinckiaceae bacterium]|nr:L,D-transpeptidase [Beijerinckiaceae bacterium]
MSRFFAKSSILAIAGAASVALAVLASQAIAQHRAAEQLDVLDEPGKVPTAEEEQLPPQYQRQLVFFRTTEAPGTIVVDSNQRFLYLVQPDNRAIRYGIGVGRDGFRWSGVLRISRKQEWPDWRPPPEMIQRQPYLPRFMAGGP